MITKAGANAIYEEENDLSVMIYEVKSPPIVQANYQKLFSSDHKHFYWNRDKFAKLKEGDRVFVVNVTARSVLNCFEPPRLYRRVIYLSQAAMPDRVKLS